jgi:hypothetical protein
MEHTEIDAGSGDQSNDDVNNNNKSSISSSNTGGIRQNRNTVIMTSAEDNRSSSLSSSASSNRDDSAASAEASEDPNNDIQTLVMMHNLSSHAIHSPVVEGSGTAGGDAIVGVVGIGQNSGDDGGSPADKSNVSRTSSAQTRRTSFRQMVQRRHPGGARNTLKAVIQAAERQTLQEQEDEQEQIERRSSHHRRQLQSSPSSSLTKPRFTKANSLRNVMDAVQNHFQDLHVTKIQAVYRGHQSRLRRHHMINATSTAASTDVTLTADDDKYTIPQPPSSYSSPPRTPTSSGRRKYACGTPGPRTYWSPTQQQQQQHLHRGGRGRGRGDGRGHQRVASEITMSDFEESLFGGDSFSSIDSLSWSPARTTTTTTTLGSTRHTKNGEEKQQQQQLSSDVGTGGDVLPGGWFQNSTLTETTAAPTDHSESEGHYHASFSSLFSADTSMDLPMKMPFRKATPPRSDLASAQNIEAATAAAATAVASMRVTSPISPPPPPPTATTASVSILPNLPVPDMPSKRELRSAQADAEVARATSGLMSEDARNERFEWSISSLPQLRPRKSSKEEWENTNQSLHLSLSSDSFDRDEPVRPPRRALSPPRPTTAMATPTSVPMSTLAGALSPSINPSSSSSATSTEMFHRSKPRDVGKEVEGSENENDNKADVSIENTVGLDKEQS